MRRRRGIDDGLPRRSAAGDGRADRRFGHGIASRARHRVRALSTQPHRTRPARLPRLKFIFDTIEQWTMTKTKFEVMDICNEHDIPVGPILSMKEIAEEKSLRDTGTVVEVDHPTRGKYLTVGNPIKLSDSPCEVQRSPLLGEHTDEILSKVLGYSGKEVAEIKASGAITPPDKSRAQAAA